MWCDIDRNVLEKDGHGAAHLFELCNQSVIVGLGLCHKAKQRACADRLLHSSLVVGIADVKLADESTSQPQDTGKRDYQRKDRTKDGFFELSHVTQQPPHSIPLSKLINFQHFCRLVAPDDVSVRQTHHVNRARTLGC